MLKRCSMALLAAAVALPATALAVDKSQSTMVNAIAATPAAPFPIAATFFGPAFGNGVSKGKTKGDSNCKIQMLLKGIAIANTDGIPGSPDDILCVSDSKVNLAGLPLDTTSVFPAEVKNGVAKVKVDLVAEGIPCVPSGGGGPPTASFESRTICYTADPAYPPPPLPFLSNPRGGVYPAGYGPHPVSPAIATGGIFFAP